jgi:hypothetical protein
MLVEYLINKKSTSVNRKMPDLAKFSEYFSHFAAQKRRLS